MFSKKTVSNEQALRKLILANLKKEYLPATKPSIDFIDHLLDETYRANIRYDISNLKPHILNFASNSTNNAPYCIALAMKMKYKSDHQEEEILLEPKDTRLVFFDVEVFPNLLLICWKYEGVDEIVRMMNPEPSEIEGLLQMRLVGFNNRRYDNHILYARYIGYDIEQVYDVSRRIVSNDRMGMFREAYGISYADTYDYCTIKQSLKQWEVDLGITHTEVEVNWDAPLPEEKFEMVAEYCENDVRATEAVHNHRIGDFHAREILADLSGLRVNSSTMAHTSKLLFGGDRNQKQAFIHPDLSKEFPGYVYDSGVSTYRGEKVGEGGYVYAEPGMYNNVLYMDVASMHPTSIEIMNIFGHYTSRYAELKKARLLIKAGNIDAAKKMFNGKLAKHLSSEGNDSLAYALKIVLNIVYGYTAARFDNAFRDDRNKDNVVAKRGALFMIDLKHALKERGCKPIHFKTDSVKVADYKESDIQFIKDFGKQYGYTFEVEGVYDQLVLINDAVLVGKFKDKTSGSLLWDAVGARFAVPYVYKTLFTKEPITFEDLVESRSVKKGTMYIKLDDGSMNFIGRVGTFCPVKKGGGILYRVQNDKEYAVTGTKGYRWQQADIIKGLDLENDIDHSYFEAMTEEALAKIAEFGDPTIFLGE